MTTWVIITIYRTHTCTYTGIYDLYVLNCCLTVYFILKRRKRKRKTVQEKCCWKLIYVMYFWVSFQSERHFHSTTTTTTRHLTHLLTLLVSILFHSFVLFFLCILFDALHEWYRTIHHVFSSLSFSLFFVVVPQFDRKWIRSQCIVCSWFYIGFSSIEIIHAMMSKRTIVTFYIYIWKHWIFFIELRVKIIEHFM